MSHFEMKIFLVEFLCMSFIYQIIQHQHGGDVQTQIKIVGKGRYRLFSHGL